MQSERDLIIKKIKTCGIPDELHSSLGGERGLIDLRLSPFKRDSIISRHFRVTVIELMTDYIFKNRHQDVTARKA